VHSSSFRRPVLLATLVAGSLAAAVMMLLPPAAAAPVPPHFEPSSFSVRGAYHVHSDRSDGTGTLEEIAAAAATADLDFVIVTDHGDGTRTLEPPTYRSGVLCLDGVEISTQDGHYVALAMSPAPYPLAGHPSDVIEDVQRLGGFGFAAHPGSPKAALRWDSDARFDGIEWLNADSEWRDEFLHSLGRVLLTYAFRPTETLAGLLDRPDEVIQRWDRALASRRVPAIAGADAHARLGFGQGGDPYEDRVVARVPSYAVSFRAFSNHVLVDRPFSGDARADAATLLHGIRDGRMFTAVDGLARLSNLEARAVSGSSSARLGEYLDLYGTAVIDARIASPPGTTLVVRRDGQVLHEVVSDTIGIDVGAHRGAYRIEAYLPPELRGSSSVPWILTNPIYIGMRTEHQRVTVGAAAAVTDRTAIAMAAWHTEASPDSESSLALGTVAGGTPALEWRFKLSDGGRRQQYAAMGMTLDSRLQTRDRLQLRVKSDGPRRLWAQLRAPGGRDGERWGKTFYVDETLRPIELGFADFQPLGFVSSERPDFVRVDSLLLVIDTLNSRPGAAGVIEIADLALAR
jgi:hypothetical protein